MITLEDNKLAKVIATAETVDGFIKKNIKLFLVVVVIAIAVSMFLTIENIIKYLTPLYNETTLWVLAGGLGVMALTKSMWLLETLLKASKGFFIWIASLIIVGIPGGILLDGVLGNIGNQDESIIERLPSSFEYVTSLVSSLFTTDIGHAMLGVLFFLFFLNESGAYDNTEVDDDEWDDDDRADGLYNLDGEVDFVRDWI